MKSAACCLEIDNFEITIEGGASKGRIANDIFLWLSVQIFKQKSEFSQAMRRDSQRCQYL